MLEIFRKVMQAIAGWWAKDRIRIARGEAKLFRVVAGDRLLVNNRLLKVISRSEKIHAGRPQVLLTLADEEVESGGDWFLKYTNYCAGVLYRVDRAGSPVDFTEQVEPQFKEQFHLLHRGQSWELLSDQISVLAGRSSNSC